MKFQFSIAGVMALTAAVAVSLWFVLTIDSLVSRVASASLVSGMAVGWIIGVRYGSKTRTLIWGVVGALLWSAIPAILDPRSFSQHPWETWFALVVFGVLGATPLASAAAAFVRGPDELIGWPTTNCVLLVWIFSIPLGLWWLPWSLRYQTPISMGINFVMSLAIATCIAAAVGAGYGLVGLFVRQICLGLRVPQNR